MFDGKFENKKPSWLKSPAGGSLELDGFNEELALAFEYQGEQHYRVVACFGDESALAKQMKNDAFKAKKCVENGVFLIQVPYTIPDANLALSVFLSVREKAQLNDLVQRVAEKKGHVWDEKEPLSNKNGPHAHAQPSIDKALKHDRLNEGKAIAQRRGGVLLSKIWLGARYLYDWKFSGCGLEWKASFDNVRRGTWCPICAIKEAGLRRRKPSHEMRAEAMALAAIKGGALVSPEWNTMHTKYQWRCEAGHLWFAAYRDIKRGSWCRACARSKTAIEMWKTRPRKASKSLALTAENH